MPHWYPEKLDTPVRVLLTGITLCSLNAAGGALLEGEGPYSQRSDFFSWTKVHPFYPISSELYKEPPVPRAQHF